VLRKKLVLLFAILETCAPFCEHIDAVSPRAGVLLWARLALAACLAGVIFSVSVILFLPWHLLASTPGGDRR
jgi:hypothetical protein